MGIRGELFTTKVTLENRAYFFNVKENRNGDVFLQIVESKNRGGGSAAEGDSRGFQHEPERRDIVLFADDMNEVMKGLDAALNFIERDRKDRAKKARAAKDERNKEKAEKAAAYLLGNSSRDAEEPKKTGRIHVVSRMK